MINLCASVLFRVQKSEFGIAESVGTCFTASPMISNARIVAYARISSARKASKSTPAVKVSTFVMTLQLQLEYVKVLYAKDRTIDTPEVEMPYALARK